MAPGTHIVSTSGLGTRAQAGDVWQNEGGKLNGGQDLSGLRGVGVWGFGFWVLGFREDGAAGPPASEAQSQRLPGAHLLTGEINREGV